MSNSNEKQIERFVEVRPAMSIQGVGVRTTNEAEAGPLAKIPSLWDRYFQSGLQASLSDKDQAIYALYTDYESDASRRTPWSSVTGWMKAQLPNRPMNCFKRTSRHPSIWCFGQGEAL